MHVPLVLLTKEIRLGAHMLSIEMGRRLRMIQVAPVCPLCPGMHVGDERHFVCGCTAFDDIRRGVQHLFRVMGPRRLFMWHPCQKDAASSSCLLQLLDRNDETLT